VPALINLANIHYSRDEIAEAQALYERAIALEPDVFEAHFNLGNIYHDLGRYPSAQVCYREALRLNPVTPKRISIWRSRWRRTASHRRRARIGAPTRNWLPNGEWVALRERVFGLGSDREHVAAPESCTELSF
jgi:tetratricopeptide (TPR) repeat protein